MHSTTLTLCTRCKKKFKIYFWPCVSEVGGCWKLESRLLFGKKTTKVMKVMTSPHLYVTWKRKKYDDRTPNCEMVDYMYNAM